MSLDWNRILDRLWLSLSGTLLIAVTLQLGAQFGARPWSIDAAILPVQAAAPGSPPRSDRPPGCRADGVPVVDPPPAPSGTPP